MNAFRLLRPPQREGTILLVLRGPWNRSGVDQVVEGLYEQFERTGVLTPRVLVLDWAAKHPVTKKGE